MWGWPGSRRHAGILAMLMSLWLAPALAACATTSPPATRNSPTATGSVTPAITTATASAAAPTQVANPVAAALPPINLQWSTPSDIDASNIIYSLSCSSPSFCVAADVNGDALTYDGHAWSPPDLIDPSVDASVGLASISCPTSSFCVSADGAGNVITYDGQWSSPTQLDSGAGLSSVSCAAQSFCVAVDKDGNAYTYNGARWSQPTAVDPTIAGQYDDDDDMAIACPTINWCDAVDESGDSLVDSNGQWSLPALVDPGQALDSIACPLPNQCIAVDKAGHGVIETGQGWSAPADIDPGPSPNSLLDDDVLAGCASAVYCVAVDINGSALTYNGQSWSTPTVVDPQQSLEAVTCPVVGWCMAVDADGNALIAQATPAQTAVEEAAVTWAESMIGSPQGVAPDGMYWEGCLLFVTDAYAKHANFPPIRAEMPSSVNSNTFPVDLWPEGETKGDFSGGTQGTDTSPPFGALVFWYSTLGTADSHVALSIGNDTLVSTDVVQPDVLGSAGIHYETMAQFQANSFNRYEGWWLPD